MQWEIKQTANLILIRTIISFILLVLGMVLTLSVLEGAGRAQVDLPPSQRRSSSSKPVSHLYNLTDQGLFLRVGNSWQKLETVPEHPVSVAVVPTNPDLLYIGTVSTGFYRSQDGGQHWQKVSPPAWNIPGVALRGTAIAIDEQDVAHLAVATAYSIGQELTGGAVYESYDAGRTWQTLAEIEEVIERLVIEDGRTKAITTSGLVQYDYSPPEVRPFFAPVAPENPY